MNVSDKLCLSGRLHRRAAVLLESVIAIVLVALLLSASYAAVMINRLQAEKAHNMALMIDFGFHYLEVVRGLDYERILPNYPINTIYDGTVSIIMPGSSTPVAVRITLPPNGNKWYSLNDNSMFLFHPDLVFLRNRNPEYRCKIDTETTGTVYRAKQISLSCRWDSIFGRGAKQTLDMNAVVYPEFR